MTPARTPAPRRRGFTLIEAIVTISVLSIVSSVVSGIILQATDGYLEGSTTAQLHTEAALALDRAVRELRKIDLDSAAAGIAPDIDDVTSTSIAWEANNLLSLTGSNLELQINGGAVSRLLTPVTVFQVRALDESNAVLGLPLTGVACDAIRRLELTITVERYGTSVTVRTRCFLRSTMSGGGSS
jgi:prepilin-type N-terminal cleavage/methylation domain-containing protein